jgi:hypothetical protein
VHVSPPTFSWSGEGVADVPHDTRADLEALCAETLLRAAGPLTTVHAVQPHVGGAGVAEVEEEGPPALRPQAYPSAGPAPPAPTPSPLGELDGFELALPDDEELVPLVLEHGEERQHTCQPFLGERSLHEHGPAGSELLRRIAAIADELELEPCPFGGAFVLAAAEALEEWVLAIGLADVLEAGVNTAVDAESTEIRFDPNRSIQLEALVDLAGIVPRLTALTALLEALPDPPIGWSTQLHEQLDPGLEQTVAVLFRVTCRVLFLQVLNTSRLALETRRNEPLFQHFAALFEQALVAEPVDADELRDLRDRLTGAATERQPTSWGGAVNALLSVLRGTAQAEPVLENGVSTIRDRRGRPWTLEELDRALADKHRREPSEEPLVRQLAAVQEVRRRFRLPRGAFSGELRRLLDDLVATNLQIALRVPDEPDLGFEFGRVVPSEGSDMVPYTIYSLQGLHQIANRTIGDAFEGDLFYSRGINLLFGTELGQRALAGPGDLGGLVEIAIVAASPVEERSRIVEPLPPPALTAGIDAAAVERLCALETALFAREHPLAVELHATLDERYRELSSALRTGSPLPEQLQAPAFRALFDELEELLEPSAPAARQSPSAAPQKPEPAPVEAFAAEGEVELSPLVAPAPPEQPQEAEEDELTFQPDGLTTGPRGYLFVESADSWAPQRLRHYATAAGRAELRRGMELRAQFSRTLSGCAGFVYRGGTASLRAIARSVLAELCEDDPLLADRIGLEDDK